MDLLSLDFDEEFIQSVIKTSGQELDGPSESASAGTIQTSESQEGVRAEEVTSSSDEQNGFE